MRLCYIDYESYWSASHSLSKINPIVYVMHPETEIQSVAIAFDDGPVEVIFGHDNIAAYYAIIDWSNVMCVAHNASGFDALVHRMRFGIRCKAWGCTMSMARPFFGLTVGIGLGVVAKALGLGTKGSLEATNTKGKKLADFTPDELERMREYNKQDTELCRAIFNALAPRLGLHELQLIDACIRMTIEPTIQADIPVLEAALHAEITRKEAALLNLAKLTGVLQPDMTAAQAVAAMKPIVMSQPRFAALLTALGAPIPMKNSPKKKNPDGSPMQIPALAKNDEGLQALLEYDNGYPETDYIIQVAAATRIEVKSTQLETRLRTFMDVANVCHGLLPMPVAYCGAVVSWRMSGMMLMNVQNMPRVNPKEPKPSDALRASLVAPPGKMIVAVDSSNIELRVAHALAGVASTLEKLRAKEDLYCWFAGFIYNRTITNADTLERFIGKVAMLSLQYGSSWSTFQTMVRVQSKGAVLLADEECQRIVALWRGMFPEIAGPEGIWKQCDKAILAMFSNRNVVIDKAGLCHTWANNTVVTPGAHWLQYPELRRETNSLGKTEWKYGRTYRTSRLYGAMLFENLCQHIARLIVMEQTMQLDKLFPVALSAHDEAVAVAEEYKAQDAKRTALEIFSTPPVWWPDLPLAAKADIGRSYSEAK